MPRVATLTEEERKQHHRENQKRYAEKQRKKPKKPTPAKPAPTRTDPALVAADINQKFRHSVIVGEGRKRGQTVVIAERMRYDHPSQCYRLKETKYTFFDDLEELKNYCSQHKISMDYNSSE